MKTELLAAHAALGNLISALPDDPLPEMPSPSGFRIIRTYGEGGATLSIELGWDLIEGLVPVLDYIGTPENPHGPQGWTPISVNASVGPNGEYATHNMLNPAGQSIILRLRWNRSADNAFSVPVELSFSVPPPE